MTPHALVDLLLHKSFFAYFLGSFAGMITIANPLSKCALFTSLTSPMPCEVRLPLRFRHDRGAVVCRRLHPGNMIA